MKVTRTSMFTGKVHTQEINCTVEQMREFLDPCRSRLIQEIFPQLTADEREFIKTGVTKEEWDAEFGGPDFEEEEVN